MSHPDAAWSPYYLAPLGVDDDPCRHYASRKRVGPTSRKRTFMILVDECGRCGRVLRSIEPLSWREYDWLRRLNRAR
jgi:hypothetical protein